MGLLGDIISGGLGIANTYYNVKTNERDFDYQKALQQQIFEREDTAVQRRMADLQAAGINPNLAAGSAAGAGSVVARSTTNDVNFGSVLDTIAAKRQIEKQKEEISNTQASTKNLNQKTDIDKIAAETNLEDFKMQRLQNLYALGFDPRVTFDRDGKLHIEGAIKTNYLSNTMLGNMFDYQFNNLKNSADMLQKQNDYFDKDKIFQYAGQLMPNINFGINKKF